MPKAIKFTKDGDYKVREIGYGRDTTDWLDVFEFDDGTTKSVPRHDPDRERWIEEAENYNEQMASDKADNGRDFSPPYEP